MTTIQLLVNGLGLALIGWIVWYFWLYQKPSVAVAEVAGIQDVRVRVKGGYDPDIIVVKAGRPVRFHFYREEEGACSEMVVFDGLDKSATLPAYEETTLELTPVIAGEYNFHCQMGMLRGKLVVE